MRLLLDERVDARVVSPLRRAGHDVALVHERERAADDHRVLAPATEEAQILVTTDLDFGELVLRTRRAGARVVLLRLDGVPQDVVAGRIDAALSRHAAALADRLLVIDRRRERRRHLAPPAGQH